MVSLSFSPLWVLESRLDVGDITVPCAKSGQLCKLYAFYDAEKAIVTPASSQNKITDRSKCLVNGFNKAQLMDFKSQSVHGITAFYIQGSAMDESSIGDAGRIICSLVSFGSFEGIKTLCEDGQLHKALQVVDLMSQTGLPVSTGIFICLLQGCIQKADLAAERKQGREQIGWLSKICSKRMFLVFEMSLDVEAIIVPRDAQYVVVLNSVTKERWILILQITDEAAASLEFPSHLWLQDLVLCY